MPDSNRARYHRKTRKSIAQLMRRHSTAAVLFHHAVAESLGLGPTDHKCLDILRERHAMTGTDLAGITGLTTGAITGVVSRLERAGYLTRENDPDDARKQILRPVPERVAIIAAVIAPLRSEVNALLDSFDASQVSAIAEFLSQTTRSIYRHIPILRGDRYLFPEAAGTPSSERAQKRKRAEPRR
ncbi:MAG: MarR family transcriptional regulator [Gemmatimonadaceae bacterium]